MISVAAYIVAVLVALVASYGAVYHGSRALHAWQHGRCLARIERLESEIWPAAPVSRAEIWQRGVMAGTTAYQSPRHPRRRSGKRGMWYDT